MQQEAIDYLRDTQEIEPPDFGKMASQKAFLSDPHRFKMLSGSFGTGKSTALCAHVTHLLYFVPGNQGFLGRFEGKTLRQSTLEVLFELLPDKSYTKNDQKGLIQLKPEFGGSKLWFGDFKDKKKLKNLNLGFFAVDQCEEIGLDHWDMMVGRLRRRIPKLTIDRRRQYEVVGHCPLSPYASKRHYAFMDSRTCELCQAELPVFCTDVREGEIEATWELHCYPNFGLGACNPEGPKHWIFQMFPGLPGLNGELSVGTDNPDLRPFVKAFSSNTEESYRANLIGKEYFVSVQAKYAKQPNMFARYVRGLWVDAEGRVYPEFAPDVHVISQYAKHYKFPVDQRPLIASEAQCYEYIDHGTTSPTAVGWVVIEQCECGCNMQNYFIFQEHYEAEKPVSHHATCIKTIRTQMPWATRATYLDSAAFGRSYFKRTNNSHSAMQSERMWAISDEYIEHGIIVQRNQKDWDAGQNRITEMLLIDPDHIHPVTGEKGAPHLLVFDNCFRFIYEMLNYKWKVARRNDLDISYREEPVDYDDHHMDGFNGLITSRPAPRKLSIHHNSQNTRSPWWVRDMQKRLYQQGKLTHMSH